MAAGCGSQSALVGVREQFRDDQILPSLPFFSLLGDFVDQKSGFTAARAANNDAHGKKQPPFAF